MPIYRKDQEIIGYVIGEKVWCKDCWVKEEPGEPTASIKVKDLKKNRYVCDSCRGEIPITYEHRLRQLQDPNSRNK